MDPISIGLLATGVAGSLFGKKKVKPATSTSGFKAMPEAVQKLLLEQYLPRITEQFNKQFQSRPMGRAREAGYSPFESQGLDELQQYSDSVGGIFNQQTHSTPEQAKSDIKTPVDGDVMKKYGMSLADYIMNSRPDVTQALGRPDVLYGLGAGRTPKPNGEFNADAAAAWWNNYGARGM